MLQESTVREHLNAMIENLSGWEEPAGRLIPTEPESDERAVIRIRLRAAIRTMRVCLGELPTDDRFDAADHRDRMRIYDSGRKDGASE
jgi:hypothetical protein